MFDENDIETIAEQLGFGYEVYIHKKTRKILCDPILNCEIMMTKM